MNWRILNWLIATFFLATVSLADAQPAKKVPRIGFLGNSTAALEVNLIEPFRDGMRALGYIEGQNIIIEYRWAEGKYERFPELIGELVGLKVEILVAAGTPAAVAVKKVARDYSSRHDSCRRSHWHGSHREPRAARRERHGLSSIAADLEGKRLELLREAIPKLSHVAVFSNPANAFHVFSEKEVQTAARAFKIKVSSLGVQSPEQFDKAFATIRKVRPGALLRTGGSSVLAQPRPHDGLRCAESLAGSVSLPGVGGGGRLDVLWAKLLKTCTGGPLPLWTRF